MHPAFRSPSGFSYLFVLFAVVLVGLSITGANALWKTTMQREREAELLFRGDQYRRAIAAYYLGQAGVHQYPLRIEDLIKDPRTSKRHLRARYRDPISGEEFLPVRCGDRIKGVMSPSQAATLKRDNFPPDYAQFSSTITYRQWVFQFQPTQAPAAGQATAPGQVVPPAVRVPAAGTIC